MRESMLNSNRERRQLQGVLLSYLRGCRQLLVSSPVGVLDEVCNSEEHTAQDRATHSLESRRCYSVPAGGMEKDAGVGGAGVEW